MLRVNQRAKMLWAKARQILNAQRFVVVTGTLATAGRDTTKVLAAATPVGMTPTQQQIPVAQASTHEHPLGPRGAEMRILELEQRLKQAKERVLKAEERAQLAEASANPERAIVQVRHCGHFAAP